MNQQALTTRTRRVDATRMTPSQRALWVHALREHLVVTPEDARALGYADGSAALRRLARRRLLKRISRGRYIAPGIGERARRQTG